MKNSPESITKSTLISRLLHTKECGKGQRSLDTPLANKRLKKMKKFSFWAFFKHNFSLGFDNFTYFGKMKNIFDNFTLTLFSLKKPRPWMLVWLGQATASGGKIWRKRERGAIFRKKQVKKSSLQSITYIHSKIFFNRYVIIRKKINQSPLPASPSSPRKWFHHFHDTWTIK